MHFIKCLVNPVKICGNIQKYSYSRLFIQRRRYSQDGMSYVHRNSKQPLVYRTIGQQLTHMVNKCPDRDAIIAVEEKKRLTYEQLRQEADRLAAGFKCLGLNKGDCIGIWTPQVIAWPLVMFAAARAGLILVAINPTYEISEMEYCLKSVGVQALVMSESFCTVSFYDKILAIIPELATNRSKIIHSSKLPLLSTIIIDSEKNYDGAFRLSDVSGLATPSEVLEIEDKQIDISPDSGCIIQFTSGTSGKPKAALQRHLSYVNNGISVTNLELWDQKICNNVPFFHAIGSLGVLMGTLTASGTVVIPSIAYNSEKWLHAIRDEKCNIVVGTPAMYVDLLNKQKMMKVDIKAKIAICSGAQCPPQLIKAIKMGLGIKKFKNAYGMTETGLTFYTRPEDNDEQETSGLVISNMEAKIIDPNGNIVPFGVAGELCIRGYNNMICYWGDDEKTREILGTDGWLKTGDQFILRPDGYAQYVDRLKDMIIRGGENIYPKEIENFLATCPQIAECYIIGVPDERLGEELCAYIRLHQGTNTFTTKDMKDFCKGKIAYFKIPRYVKVVQDFPRTQTGKVQKFKLQEMFQAKKT